MGTQNCPVDPGVVFGYLIEGRCQAVIGAAYATHEMRYEADGWTAQIGSNGDGIEMMISTDSHWWTFDGCGRQIGDGPL